LIATYNFVDVVGPEAKDRHLLNRFFIANGVKVKEGTTIMTEGKEAEKEKDEFSLDIIQEGTGNEITPGSIVAMHYTGKHDNGDVFDSSHTRKQPHKFKHGINQVIGCWDKAVIQPGMRKGTIAQITCPASLAYGVGGTKVIKGGETIFFDLEVVDFRP